MSLRRNFERLGKIVDAYNIFNAKPFLKGRLRTRFIYYSHTGRYVPHFVNAS